MMPNLPHAPSGGTRTALTSAVQRYADAPSHAAIRLELRYWLLTSRHGKNQLRLGEARRLMTAEGLSAGQAALRVGYQGPSHFSRDFARLFGAPSVRDRVARSNPVARAAVAV